jgi:hypothetical protein
VVAAEGRIAEEGEEGGGCLIFCCRRGRQVVGEDGKCRCGGARATAANVTVATGGNRRGEDFEFAATVATVEITGATAWPGEVLGAPALDGYTLERASRTGTPEGTAAEVRVAFTQLEEEDFIVEGRGRSPPGSRRSFALR